ncbi:MAG: secretin N-terminal domain-containing protein, partial [Planctomycetaceae bacterium]
MLNRTRPLIITGLFALMLGYGVGVVRAQFGGGLATAPNCPKTPKPAASEKLSTKVFRLRTVDLEDAQAAPETLLSQLPDESTDTEIKPGPNGGLGGGGGDFGSGGGSFGGGSFGGGSFGGGGVGTGAAIVVHKRTNSLVVRGTKREIQVAIDLITVLETPSEKELPKTSSLLAIQLMHADADDLNELLEELDVEADLLPLA